VQIIAEVDLWQRDSIGSTVDGNSTDVLGSGVVGGDGRAGGAVTRIARIVVVLGEAAAFVVSGVLVRASANDSARSGGLYGGGCGCNGQKGGGGCGGRERSHCRGRSRGCGGDALG
jgi:hypothetical protein